MRYRAFVIPGLGILGVLVGFLIWGGLADNFVYYQTPAEALENKAEFGEERRFRLAGFVVPGTVEETFDGVRFDAWDDGATVSVLHRKSPPQLFQEDIQVVVEGNWEGDVFVSDTMLIKHDEEYRVPDGGNYPGGEAGG